MMGTNTVETYDGQGNLIATRTYESDPATDNRNALDQRMDQALDGLRTYVNNASPTTAQTVAVVKLLCRVVIAIVRIMRGRLDGTD